MGHLPAPVRITTPDVSKAASGLAALFGRKGSSAPAVSTASPPQMREAVEVDGVEDFIDIEDGPISEVSDAPMPEVRMTLGELRQQRRLMTETRKPSSIAATIIASMGKSR